MRADSLLEPRSKTPQPPLEHARHDALERLAWLLDSAILVPGTRFRIGLDALIGLVPGIGDLIGAALSAYIVAAAARRGLPGSALLRMTLNVGIETLVGAVPIVGDLFDAVWKANQRNVALLRLPPCLTALTPKAGSSWPAGCWCCSPSWRVSQCSPTPCSAGSGSRRNEA